jgi:acrylyl-CoA reductase (NADPH)
MASIARREAAWAQLANDLDRSRLAAITQEINLADAIGAASDILAGRIRGRVVVNVNA